MKKRRMRNGLTKTFARILGILSLQMPVYAYDLSNSLSIGGVLAGAGQCQALDEGAGERDACRSALPFRPHLSFRPTGRDELYTELGFAAGSGLNKTSPFQLEPWGADLEDAVKDVNGRGRNYLLTAWYRYELRFSPDNSLSATLGLIDSTDFLDANAFANDEFTQFMNEAFVNSTQVFLPSYDLGAAVRWDLGSWSLRAVSMNVGKEDEDIEGGNGRLTDRDLGDDYDFAGAEIGYSIRTALGEGNYRILYTRTSRDFVDPSGSRGERRTALAVSFDQELGDGFGAFIRVGALSDKAAIPHKSIYSGGLDIRGRFWGRESDNIGLGLAYLSGGNQDTGYTRVAEVYYRAVLDEPIAITADLQYMKEAKKSGEEPHGFIFGIRADLHF